MSEGGEPIIDVSSDQYFMGEALREAMKAYRREEVPVGAVIVKDGQIIARAEGRAILQALAERVSSIEFAGDPVWRPNNSMRALDTLPLKLR